MLTMPLLGPILPFFWMTLSLPFTLFITVLNHQGNSQHTFSMQSRVFLGRVKTEVTKNYLNS